LGRKSYNTKNDAGVIIEVGIHVRKEVVGHHLIDSDHWVYRSAAVITGNPAGCRRERPRRRQLISTLT